MSPGESSNSNNNSSRSLPNNDNNSNPSTNPHHGSTTSPDGSYKPSSSNIIERTSSSIADDSSNFDLGDDIGWFCSLCTFRNSADKFKCEMCDLRRGTSTRKPRCNAETIVAQVVKQQEQIRQQTRVKTPKSSRSTTSTNLNISSPGSSKIRSKTSKSSRLNTEISHSDSEEHLPDTNSIPKSKKKKKHDTKARSQKSKRPKQSINNRPPKEENDESTESDYSSSSESSSGASDSSSSSSDSSDNTSESSSTFTNPSSEDESDGPEATIQDSHSPMIPINPRELDVKPIKRPVSIPSPLPQIKTPSDNPFKITPLEVSGNLIKYSPPTSSGRTGLIIDKKRFTQHSVTVNDVTITFTEFATRQNTYVRKKKKRRDGSRPKNSNGNSKSRSRSQPKSSSNSASTTAAEAP